MENSDLIKELSKLVNYKDKNGDYNRLIQTDNDSSREIQGFRDEKRVRLRESTGARVAKTEDGYYIPTTIDEILIRAFINGASDVHISVGAPPKMRLNGEMIQMPYTFLSPHDTKSLLSNLLNTDTKQIFESDGDIDFAYSLPGVCRFRVNMYKQRGSWAAVFRILSNRIPSVDELEIPEVVRELTERKRGLVLVTGPTGSGKSTTLASLVQLINESSRRNIITLEDPIEYLHQHKYCSINQREMGSDSKSFASAIRAALREDPDVILVGEMRDPETISIAITAAETGHLVFSTLHTIGAAATIDRIIDSFNEAEQAQIRTQLAMALEGVISQQLIPTIDGKSRKAAFEIMICNPAIRNLIRDNKAHMIDQYLQVNRKLGMIMMDDCIAQMFQQGVISYDKAVEFAVDKIQMQSRLR